ncbi:peptidoglycan-recognition protein SC2-like [Bufo bufo]|uniref:peptidoglycan-recognition protein SC2-like n=1 Tax=Bufo bufo TaxID=8384 RepID=UPI001ABE1C9E|nr:peptidoglycan-recognition protein SC2-like [Bufo bufo]XP_040298139.1 peptidoglycan-recognition protein SC2-like [Bufo bufo]
MIRLILLLAAACVMAYGCPSIISKSTWSTRNTNCRDALKTPVPWVIIHHTVTPTCTSTAACTTQLRNILDYHTRTNKWCDIGYNFLIGNDGNIYEGRGWSKVGAHAKGSNSISIGIAFIGDFQKGLPSQAAINAAKLLIQCGVSLKMIENKYTLKGHLDVFSTACPGNELYNNIKTWPRFKAGKQSLP